MKTAPAGREGICPRPGPADPARRSRDKPPGEKLGLDPQKRWVLARATISTARVWAHAGSPVRGHNGRGPPTPCWLLVPVNETGWNWMELNGTEWNCMELNIQNWPISRLGCWRFSGEPVQSLRRQGTPTTPTYPGPGEEENLKSCVSAYPAELSLASANECPRFEARAAAWLQRTCTRMGRVNTSNAFNNHLSLKMT